MKCTPCRVTVAVFDGIAFTDKRFHVFTDGSVQDVDRTKPASVTLIGEKHAASSDMAKKVRAEAARQRRNRNARDKHEALTSLGLVRVRGSLGGTFYE